LEAQRVVLPGMTASIITVGGGLVRGRRRQPDACRA
jgi:hypothetical protein